MRLLPSLQKASVRGTPFGGLLKTKLLIATPEEVTTAQVPLAQLTVAVLVTAVIDWQDGGISSKPDAVLHTGLAWFNVLTVSVNGAGTLTELVEGFMGVELPAEDVIHLTGWPDP